MKNKYTMKIVLLLLLGLSFAFDLQCQEVYTDKSSPASNSYLFLGAVRTNKQKVTEVKVWGNDRIEYKALDELMQSDLLIGEDFTDTLFKQGLHFQLEGYEPFWKAKIEKNSLSILDLESGQEQKQAVRFYTNKQRVDPGFFAMFSTENGTIFGTINYIGIARGQEQQTCEYLIAEDESLYEVYISIEAQIYRGCATITGNRMK